MKNKLIFGLLFSMLVALCGCEEDFFTLDKKPLEIISNAVIFDDPALIDAYLAKGYENGLHFYHGQWDPVHWTMDEAMGAVCKNIADWQTPNALALKVFDENGCGDFEYWDYKTVRFLNEFLKGMETSSLAEAKIKIYMAEARVLRANVYFNMVKRYGGVPIITIPQDDTTPDSELYPKRNSEKECYDFISQELDLAITDLPEESVKGRINRFVAYAMKSRMMLYAASVANFGTVQMEGLLGFPQSEAKGYYKQAYDAGLEVIGSAKYDLYKGNEDKVENFKGIFTDESATNIEPILSVVFDKGLGKMHSYGVGAIPMGFRVEWGSNYHAFRNIVEEFEYADGTSGIIDRNKVSNGDLFTLNELFGNRDPRFKATFFYPEAPFQGGLVYLHKGTMYKGQLVTSGTIEGNWPAVGQKRDIKQTCIMVRKHLNENEVAPIKGSSDNDYHLYRYAEVLLNTAEAAFYIDKEGEAKIWIDDIRERAGMPELDNITEEAIRHERTVELVFEDTRYWDLRRWRIAHAKLNGLQTQGFTFIKHYEEDAYEVKFKNAEATPRVFQERHYYLPIGIKIISNNSNLIDNPDY